MYGGFATTKSYFVDKIIACFTSVDKCAASESQHTVSDNKFRSLGKVFFSFFGTFMSEPKVFDSENKCRSENNSSLVTLGVSTDFSVA